MSTKGSPYQDGEDQMEGLGEALSSFSQGIQKFGQTMAITNANKQVRQIQTSAMKDAEKESALHQVAQQMVFQMHATGVDPNRIKQMFTATEPVKETIQSLEQGLFSKHPEMVKRAQAGIASEQGFKLKLAEAGIEKQGRIMDMRDERLQAKEHRQVERTAMTAFGKESRDIEKASKQAQTAMNVLKAGNDVSIMAKSILPTLLARASGEVGNLTEMERSVFEGRQDVKSVLERYAAGKLTGKLTPGDVEALRAVAQVYLTSAAEMKKQRAQFYVDQAGNYTGKAKRKLGSTIAPGIALNFDDEAPAAPQQQDLPASAFGSAPQAPAAQNSMDLRGYEE